MRIDVNNDNKVSVSKVNEIDKNVTKSTGADKNEIFDAGVMTMKFSDVNKSSKAFGILEQDISADDIKAKAEVIKNNLSVIESQMESGNVVKVDDEGIDINNTRTDKIVTVVERIQIKLAAYCDDFNITATGIDMEDIKAVTGNAATYKAAALMSDSEKAYLVKNKLEPTIENVYHAIHSGAKDNTCNLLIDDEWNEMLPQVENIIKDVGLDVNEDTLSLSRYMIDNEIPLDKENLQYFDMLNKLETPDDKTVTERIAAAVIEGKSPEKTKVTGEKQPFENTVRAIAVLAQADMYNIMALAKEDVRTLDVLADIEADDTGIEPDFDNQTFAKTYRMIQETRLMMTIEAGRFLENNGISVNTTELSELVENLKKYEAAAMTENTDTEVSVEEVDRVNDILLAMEQLKTSPAAVLGEVKDEEKITPELLSVRTDRSMTAAKEYETLSTEVRTDLGDNINKAIKASTDDILSGMGYENNEENRRAVRILAYNNLEMTEKNIDRIKDLDKSVNLLFKSMTGEKTLKMIRDGKNPLTTDIRELCDYFNNIPDEEKIEKYSEFLYRLDKDNKITPEEREKYLAVYSLINKFEKDGMTALGQVYDCNMEFTMGNLLTSYMTLKSGGVDRTAKEDTGIGEIKDKVSYYKHLFAQIGNKVTPETLEKMTDIDDLSFEKFAEQVEKEYENNISEENIKDIENAVNAESDVMKFMAQYEVPATINNINEVRKLLKKPEKVFEKTDGSRLADNTDDKDKLLQEYETISRKAHEEIMNSLYENQDRLDIRSLKQINTSMKLLNGLAKKNNFFFPCRQDGKEILVNLKVVESGSDKGSFQISFNGEKYGKISIEGKINKNSLNVNILSDNSEALGNIQKKAEMLEEKLADFNNVNITTGKSDEIPEIQAKINENVSTEKLFKTAKIFILEFAN